MEYPSRRCEAFGSWEKRSWKEGLDCPADRASLLFATIRIHRPVINLSGTIWTAEPPCEVCRDVLDCFQPYGDAQQAVTDSGCIPVFLADTSMRCCRWMSKRTFHIAQIGCDRKHAD